MNKDAFITASIMGTNFVANILVGIAIGFILDYYLHSKLLFFLFVLFGVIAAIYTLYKDTKTLLKQEQKNEDIT